MLGYSQTIDDITELKALSEIPSPASYPHTYRWASHIIALTGISSIAKGTTTTVTAAVASSTKAAAAKTDDFDDLFGDDEEEEVLNDDGENAEEAAATKARQARMVSDAIDVVPASLYVCLYVCLSVCLSI